VTVEELNRLPEPAARAAFARCCGTAAWVGRMCAARPFRDRAAILEEAERAWSGLDASGRREAFTHHPRIGEIAALREKFVTTAKWASDEQRGAAMASEATLAALADRNRAYESRFGYIFIVCATGKSAEEMLALLEARMGNDPDTELEIAAGEQMKITRLRIEKLVEESR